MGAWLMLLAAMERPHRIHALVGIASGPDSPRPFKHLSPKALEELKVTGETLLESEYGSYVITQRFLDDINNQHNILDGPTLPLTCPVRLLHGMADRFVPYELSLKLSEKIQSEDILVLLRKHGDHELSHLQDIQVLFEQLDSLVGRVDSHDLATKVLTRSAL